MPKSPGERIGRYIIDRRLGVGGMAEAYLAHQEGPAGFVKPVVVKVLLDQHASDPKMIELFLREARVGARLNHANIVQIFDLGEADGAYYIAMEYVDGLTLLQATKRCWAIGQGIPIDIAVRVVCGAAVGLHYAHTLKDVDGNDIGLVHRDISPDNIIVARDGTVKLLDFGVAKLRGTEGTNSGEIKGKIPFMSPEQLESEDVDARTDLWSLGVTLYWCLAGKRPFRAATDVHTIRAVLDNVPTPVRSENKIVSPELDELVMSLLEKDRTKRPASALKLAARLERLVPPAQGSPLAKFIEKLVLFNDDPPESRSHVGTVKGIPAAPAAGEGTDLIVRDATHDAELVATGEGPPSGAPELITAEDDVASSADATAAKVTGTVVIERAAPEKKPRPQRAALLVGAGVVVAAVAIFAVARGGSSAPAPASASESVPSLPSAPPSTSAPATAPPSTPPESAPLADLAPVESAPVSADPHPVHAVAVRTVAATAPAAIRWVTVAGKALGNGTHALQVPETEKTIIAIDPRRDARVVVNVAARIDWDALPKGTLVVRALPYATDVKLGGESLGPTPLKPQSVVAGASATYKVVVVKDGQSAVKVVKVKPNEESLVTVDLRAPPK